MMFFCRQDHGEGAAFTRFAFDGNFTAVILNDTIADRQAEAGAFSRRLGCKKWIEDAFQIPFRYAMPVIAHFYRNRFGCFVVTGPYLDLSAFMMRLINTCLIFFSSRRMAGACSS